MIELVVAIAIVLMALIPFTPAVTWLMWLYGAWQNDQFVKSVHRRNPTKWKVRKNGW